MKQRERKTKKSLSLQRLALRATRSVGSPESILLHTVFFIGMFSLSFVGWTFERILLFLTTVVSLEAIYLAIFIQMTVNLNTRRLYEVSKDVEEIQEDVGSIQEDVADLQEDVEDMSGEASEDEEKGGESFEPKNIPSSVTSEEEGIIQKITHPFRV